MKALIDADLIVYRVAWTTPGDPVGIAFWRAEETLRGIKDALKTDEYDCFITSSDQSNFRLELFPEYKANRANKEKPPHYHALRDFFLERHGAELVMDQEADDALGIAQKHPDTCIVSIDKDLNQIPGYHYDFVKKVFYEVSEADGLRWFYEQLLKGDSTDNIPGVKGIGHIRAKKILEGISNPKELYNAVLKKYLEELGSQEEAERMVLRNGRLLKIRTQEGELWQPPV